MPKNGFSLVEILVVIGIVSVLSVLGITAYSSAQQKARDTKRMADIDAIAKAMQYKYNIKSARYPILTPDLLNLKGGFPDNQIPYPPRNEDYIIGSDGKSYIACTKLEVAPAGFKVQDCISTVDTGVNRENCYCQKSIAAAPEKLIEAATLGVYPGITPGAPSLLAVVTLSPGTGASYTQTFSCPEPTGATPAQFTFTLPYGWYLFSLPIDKGSCYMASDLYQELGGGSVVQAIYGNVDPNKYTTLSTQTGGFVWNSCYAPVAGCSDLTASESPPCPAGSTFPCTIRRESVDYPIPQGMGVFIKASAANTVTIEGWQSNLTTIHFVKGWNLVGFGSTSGLVTPTSIDTMGELGQSLISQSLINSGGNILEINGWRNGGWTAYVPDYSFNRTIPIEAGKGYFVNTSSPFIYTVPR